MIIIFLATMLASVAHAQEEDMEVHNQNLRGIAKSLTFYCYEAITGDADSSYAWLKYKSTQKYNDRGLITEYRMYGRRFILPKYIDSYEYNQKGQLRKVKYEDKDDPSLVEIEYDNEGNRIKEQTYTLSHELQYVSRRLFKNRKLIEEDITNVTQPEHPLRRISTYDSKGNNILFRIIDRTGKLIVVTSNKYDNKGKVLSFVTKDFNDNITKTGSYSYKYFPNGNLKEETYYSGKYPSMKTIYDSMGRVLREINYSGDGPNDIMSDERFKYDKTDSRGNWTQRSRYNNGHRTRLEIRQIEY